MGNHYRFATLIGLKFFTITVGEGIKEWRKD